MKLKMIILGLLTIMCGITVAAQDYMAKARQAYSAGNYDDCIRYCKVYNSLNPDTNPDPILYRAERLSSCSDLDDNWAAQSYIVQYNSGDSRAKNRLGRLKAPDEAMGIFFEPGKGEFDGSQHALLTGIVEAMAKNNNVYVITGYCDNLTGSETGNNTLRRNRAAAVAKALEDRGIKSSRLEIQTKDNANWGSGRKTGFLNNIVSIVKSDRVVTDIKPSVTISNVRVEQNQELSDGKGIIIHLRMDISNMKGKSTRVTAYMYDVNGKALIDKNDKYNTTSNEVCVGKTVTPSYDNAYWEDLTLSIPYSELHLTSTATQTIKFDFWVWDYSQSTHKAIYQGTEKYSFTYSGTSAEPKASIEKVWVEHNQMINNEKSMVIHAKFDAENLKGRNCYAAAYFYYEEGNYVRVIRKDAPLKYKTDDGHLSTGKDFTPSYDSSTFSDFTVTIPNSEFNQWSGTGQKLKISFTIFVKEYDGSWKQLTTTTVDQLAHVTIN